MAQTTQIHGTPLAADAGPTPRQREVLAALVEHFRRRGHLPTFRDMCRLFNFASTNAVIGHYRLLERHGYLRRVRFHSWDAWELTPRALPAGPVPRAESGAVVLPAAGRPLTPAEARALAEALHRAAAAAEEMPRD